MSRVVQLCVILCCLVKSLSICTDSRQQGVIVYVDFSSAPLFETNVSCSCFLFAQTDTEIITSHETSSASDIILINTSIRLGDQTFQEATKDFIKLSANSSKKLHFNGAIGQQPPGVCLKFNSTEGSTQGNIEVVCLRNNDTTVPTSVFATTTKATTGTTSDTSKQPSFKTTKVIIGGAIGGGFLVIVLVTVVIVIMCRRRRLSASQNKEQPKIQTIASQEEENIYNVENALYISADYDIRPSGNRAYADTFSTGYDVTHDKTKTTHEVTKQSSENENYYDQSDQFNPKQDVDNMSRSINEYSVVFTNKKNTSSVDDTDNYDHVERV